MLDNLNSKFPIRLWIKRKIEKAGWNDRKLCYVIGNRKAYILGFADDAMLIWGRIIK